MNLLPHLGRQWHLKYINTCRGETDVPDRIAEFVSQRRRWLNGSWFAMFYAILHFFRLYRTNHSIIRKFFFTFEFLYFTINTIFSWFALGNFYLTFFFLSKQTYLTDDSIGSKVIYLIAQTVYVIFLMLIVVASLGNRPQGTKILYNFACVLYGVISCWMLFMCVYVLYLGFHAHPVTSLSDLWRVPTIRDVGVSLLSTYGLYIVSSALFLDAWHMVTSFLQYMLLMPSYINLLTVYAFCNTVTRRSAHGLMLCRSMM